MNVTLDYLKSNRKWLVRDFQVWGTADSLASPLLFTEDIGSSKRILFSYELCGGDDQVVEFADLIDHRGNALPSDISNAAVIIIPKCDVTAFLVGGIGPSSFRIAKASGYSANSTVDLLIMEMN